ncbi:hypothetical protein CSB08_00080 [Candidatus Gracilibacteria bacterium]|nr:MAG: hypothetical protein CSB08_00080 [Candidatus Gracilibacteria bacterium]PIE85695.1 MAG: hypothetical protein CSA08_00660 [Candidatus Gracilibacteria bacterium]
MPIAFKCILNFIYYLIYSFIGIFIGDLFYGGILYHFGKNIPGPSDPIHIKIALAACLFVLVSTVILRKYFYIELSTNKK